VVGAHHDDGGDVHDAGAVYIFKRSGTLWSEEGKLVASDKEVYAFFGYSVALEADMVVVGARYDDGGGVSDAGAVYVFKRNGTLWSEEAKLVASNKEASALFGVSVALEGDTIVAGAHRDDGGAVTDAGAVYIYEGLDDPSSQPTYSPSSLPSSEPSSSPSASPSGNPSSVPSALPTGLPTGQPTAHPTGLPTGQPTAHPTNTPRLPKDDDDDDDTNDFDAGSVAGIVVGVLIAVLGGGYTIFHYRGQPNDKGQAKVRPPEDTKGLASVVPA
jgi:hypothetical protein